MVDISTEVNGRYTEIYIEGIPNGSIAYDEKEDELIVDGEARSRDNGVVVELPDSPQTFEEGS